MQIGSLDTTTLLQRNDQTQLNRLSQTQEVAQSVQNVLLFNQNTSTYQNQFSAVGQDIMAQNSLVGEYQLANVALQGLNAGAQRLEQINQSLSNGENSQAQTNALNEEFGSITNSMNELIGQNPQLNGNLNTSSLNSSNAESIYEFQDSLQNLSSGVAQGLSDTTAYLENILPQSQSLDQSYLNPTSFNQSTYNQNVQSQQFAQVVSGLLR